VILRAFRTYGRRRFVCPTWVGKLETWKNERHDCNEHFLNNSYVTSLLLAQSTAMNTSNQLRSVI